MGTITEADVEQVALEWRPNIVLFLDFGLNWQTPASFM